MTNIDLAEFNKKIKINSLKMVYNAKASHIGSALSISEIMTVLYGEIMNIDPDKPEKIDRDRFILSKGHACVAVYAALSIRGYFSQYELESYGKNDSIYMNHISHKVSGVEFSTGSLGQGLSFGVGKALYAKMNNLAWDVYVLISDGELNEGSNWEAFMFAAHQKLDNLIVIVDYNKIQSLDTVEKTLGIEPLGDKFESFGLHVRSCNGNNIQSLQKCFKDLKAETSRKPKILIANTTKGSGVSFMENKVSWHYKSPNKDELELAIMELENEK